MKPLHWPLSVSDNLDNKLVVTPNPFDSYFIININEPVKYELYDLFGRLLLVGEDKKVNTAFLGSGIYLLRLTIHENETKTIKLIKNKL
jgi:hypothetical protein